jgi:hypothetical protein
MCLLPGEAPVGADDAGDPLPASGVQGVAAPTHHIGQRTDACLTLGGGHAFLIDRDQIVALDLESGKEAWRTGAPLQDQEIGDAGFRFSDCYTVVYYSGTLYGAQIRPGTGKLQRWQLKPITVAAYEAGPAGRGGG